MTLEEILKDRKTYPDDSKVPFGETTFTLGELRAIQDAGVNLTSTLKEEQEKRKVAEDTLLSTWQELQGLKSRGNEPPAKVENIDDWRKDPLFAPLAKDFEGVQTKLGGFEKSIDEKNAMLLNAIKYLSTRALRSDYLILPEEFRKEVTFEQAVKTALEKGYKDLGNMPAVDRVFAEWEAPHAEQKKKAEWRKEWEKEQKDKQAAAMIPRPGASVGQGAPDPNAPKNIKEAIARAKSDPEILELIYGTKGTA